MARRRPNATEAPIEELAGRTPEGKPVVRTWTIVGSQKYGPPLAGDEVIYVAVTKLLEHYDFERTTVPCTRYQICELLQVKPDGRVYKRIANAFTRFANTKREVP